MLDYVVNLAHFAVSAIASGVAPAFGPAATAAAIVFFTVAVRLLISPLSWAQIRGARVSPLAGCLPALVQAPFFFLMYRLFTTTPNDLLDAELAGVPLGHHLTDALTPEAAVVYAVLLTLLALLAWRSSRRIREAPLAAAGVSPAGGPGGARMRPGSTGEGGDAAAVERAQEQVRRVLAFAPYLTLVAAVFVPLAAGLYLATTAAWTALEQAVLRRHR